MSPRQRLLSIVLLAVFLAIAGGVLPAAADELYVVQPGDTLYRIALRFNTTVSALMQANNLTNSNWITVGQQLLVPGPGEAVFPTKPPTTEPGMGSYVVKSGDTLSAIARQTGVSVTAIAQANGIINPSLIYVGQELVIPGSTATPAPVASPEPAAAPESGGGFHYTVQPGDTLIGIALKYNTTYAVLATSNQLSNASIIYVGQQLWIPAAGGAPAPESAPAPALTPVPSAPLPASSTDFGYGIQVHLPGGDMDRVLTAVNDLGMGWVKQQIEWKVYESSRSQFNWSDLDAMVDQAAAHNVRLLFSVVKAPRWARNTGEEDGPPADYQDYWNFVGALSSRYRGRVAAYEIWNEQNLRREWNGDALSASRYMQLLAGAYNAIKAADPAAIVVSGALAPTGWNDGVTAIDDRVYLDAMYAAGLKSYSDAIGAHPNGWANAPSASCCRQESTVPSHNDHPSFFFKHTLEDYWNIMVRYGDSGTRIWATEFGWGSVEGLGTSAQTGYEFVTYNSEAEQASYLVEAFSQARAYNFVGVIFVWNLNFCPVAGAGAEQCYWGIVRPNWSARPAYGALKAMAKP